MRTFPDAPGGGSLAFGHSPSEGSGVPDERSRRSMAADGFTPTVKEDLTD